MYGVRKVEKKKDFENLDSFWDTLYRAGKIYNVRHAWTLKKLMGRVKEFTRGDDNCDGVFRTHLQR